MKTISYPFAILRAQPNQLRGESVNVGIVVFADGKLHAAIDANPHRLRAIDPDLALLPIWNTLQSDIERLAEKLPTLETQHHILKTLLAPIYADDNLGEIYLDESEDLLARIDSLMTKFVRLPARTLRPQKAHVGEKVSKLNYQLRTWFRMAKVYSSNVADLSKHRVVPNYPIAANNDLYAEFALMNGVIHVIETLDFRGHDKVTESVRRNAAMKSIVLDQAKRTLDIKSKKIAVVAASDYGAMRPAIGIINSYADDVITMDSAKDRQRLADFIAETLHAPKLPELI